MANPLRRLLDAAMRPAETSPSPDSPDDDHLERPMTDQPLTAPAEQQRPLPQAVDTELHEGDRLALAQVERLRIHVPKGGVDVIGRDEAETLVEVQEAGRPVPVLLEAGALRIGTPHGSGGRAVITVAVQRRALVEVEGTSTAVLVSGMKQGLAVRTVSGEVVCDATAGVARLESVSGELALREHEGSVGITTVSGAATASGPVTGLEHRGVSGDVFLDLEAPDRVDVRTVSGEVVLRLGAERPAEYALDTVSGELHLDGVDLHRRAGGHRGRWDGAVGEATTVRVSTSSGSVRIVHAVET